MVSIINSWIEYSKASKYAASRKADIVDTQCFTQSEGFTQL